MLDKTLEYVRTPHVQHTANEWQTTEHNRHIRSNRVYQMNYYIYENTRYDKEAQKSIPYSWTLTWSVRTNSPSRTQAKIAGQDRKVFTDKAAMEKYLNGRIKAYDRLFTEISPPIPQEYADYFKVNGMLMPDYTIEGEEPPQQQQAAAIPENTGQEKEREHMSEQFSIMIGNRSRFDAGDPGGYWLDMPATKEQLHEAMRNVGITADNPQDFSIRGYSDDPEKHIALPYEMVCAADVDELNFLAARLEQLDPAEVGKLNAALQQKNGLANIGQVIDFTYNVDFYVHIPEVHNYHDLGDYYLNQSGMVQMPEEWKGGIDLSTFGRNAAAQEKGAFTEYGYIVESGDEWERQFEGREVPEEYRIMSYPQPERGEQDKAYMDAAETQQADAQAAEPQQPRPVVPIILTSEKPAEKVKEITARLEQGVQAIFDSDRYKEFLTAMEECMKSMYSSWYRQDKNNEEIIIDKYFIDGKEYGIASWGGEGNYTEFDIYYMDDTENKIHVSLTPDFAYMNVSEEPTMMLSIGDMWYSNYTSSQAKEYAEMNEAQQEEYENAQTAEYYFPGYAYSNSLGAYVYYAYIGYDKEQKTNVVKVECTIGNIGSSNIQFVAANYFSLNYDGVITSARSTQYDYTTLAPGGQFTTELVFNCPSAKRISDTFNMKMIMENSEIHLAPAPQTEEEQLKFPGVYMKSSPSYDFLYIVTDKGNGTYEIITIDDFWGVSAYQGITLRENNRFEMGAGDFRWKPNNYEISSYDYDEETWGEPYTKQNPLK